jgi:hypothetical protein
VVHSWDGSLDWLAEYAGLPDDDWALRLAAFLNEGVVAGDEHVQFDPNWLRNAVLEPLDKADVELDE